jgi:hypothetical protein
VSKVEARFYIAESTEHGAQGAEGQHTGRILAVAVSRGDQNKSWTVATPAARLEMTINNPSAFEQMREWQRAGKDLRVVIEPVETAKPADGHPWRQATEADGQVGLSYYSTDGKCGECGEMRFLGVAGDQRPTHKHDIDAGITGPPFPAAVRPS